MIVLDTHIWIWWADNNPRLTQQHRQWIQQYQSQVYDSAVETASTHTKSASAD